MINLSFLKRLPRTLYTSNYLSYFLNCPVLSRVSRVADSKLSELQPSTAAVVTRLCQSSTMTMPSRTFSARQEIYEAVFHIYIYIYDLCTNISEPCIRVKCREENDLFYSVFRRDPLSSETEYLPIFIRAAKTRTKIRTRKIGRR